MVPRKLIEAIFRSLWIVLLPVILVPVLVVMLVDTEVVYESGATVWVSRPEGIDSGALASGDSAFRTHAENQVQVFNDLLSTQSFRLAIAIEANLIPADSSEALVKQATDFVAKNVSVSALGTNLIGIHARGTTAEEAYAIANAVITQYQVRAADETGRQAAIAVAYYTEQLGLAEEELKVREDALLAYVAANPALATPEARETDLNYLRLNGRVEAQTQVIDTLAAQLQEIELKSSSAPQSQEAVFSVQDAPRFPDEPLPTSITTTVGFPLAGFVLGLLISASYVYVMYRLDQTVRSEEDLEDLDVPLLGYVPELRKGPGLGLWQYTPVAWVLRARSRNYARRVAASIASLPVPKGGA